MDKLHDNKCTLRNFTRGLKTASARWWGRNNSNIEIAVFGMECAAIFSMVICLLYCLVSFLLCEGTYITDFIVYAVFITTSCVAGGFTILRLIQAVKACCEAGEDV